MKPIGQYRQCSCGFVTQRLAQHERSKAHQWMMDARAALRAGYVPAMRSDAASLARQYPNALVRRGDRPSGAYRPRTIYAGRGAVPSAAWYYDPLAWHTLPSDAVLHYLEAVRQLEEAKREGLDDAEIILAFWSRGVSR